MHYVTSASTEVLPLGNGLCLYNHTGPALSILNPTASEIWRARARGASDDDVARELCSRYGISIGTARRDIEQAVRQWYDAGLLEKAFLYGEQAAAEPASDNQIAPASPGRLLDRDIPQQSPNRPARPARTQAVSPFPNSSGSPFFAAPSSAAPSPAYLDACYGQAGVASLRLICREEVLAGLLQAVLEPLRLPATTRLSNGNAAGFSTIEIGHDDAGSGDASRNQDAADYWLKLPDGEHLTGLPRALARRLVLRQMLLQRHRPQGNPRPPVSAILHASAVELDGICLALAGNSGSGKTTLTAKLVSKGAHYIADDLVPLFGGGGCQIGDFTVSLAVKEGSWPVVSAFFPELAALPALTTRRLRVRYLDPAAQQEAPPSRRVKLDMILFPQFQSGADLQSQRLSPEETFAALIESGTAPEAAPPSLRSLTELANRVPAWRLRYGDLDDAIEQIAVLRQELVVGGRANAGSVDAV